MSIVSMQKMSLVAHKSERSKLLRLFVKAGCVEPVEAKLIDDTEYPADAAKRDALEGKSLKVSFALTFLKEAVREFALIDKKNVPEADFKRENRLVAPEEYDFAAKEEVEIFSKISRLEDINSRLIDIKSEKARFAALREQLAVYAPLKVPFSLLKDTGTTAVFAGAFPAAKKDALMSEKPELGEIFVFEGDKLLPVVAFCHKSEKEKLLSILSSCDFVGCPFGYDVAAEEKLAETDAKLEELEEERKRRVNEACGYLPMLSELKILFDHYRLEIAKFDAIAMSPHTRKAFVTEGWVPTEKVESLTAEIKEKCKRTEIFFRDPEDCELPPTLTRNPKAVDAFSGIVDMFGSPNYRERDPKLFVAIYYFLFFGIMIGDAGYGLLMTIACFAFLKIVKPVKDSGRMIAMFGLCGISTIIWGALFGGWFGVTLPRGGFLDRITWFNPMNDSLKMFMLSLGMGVLHIGTGFFLKGVALIKAGRPFDAIFNQFSWIIIFAGLILASPKLMLFLGAIRVNPVPEAFGLCAKIGMYTMLAGFVVLLVGGASGKKNPLKMVMGSFQNIYGAINIVSDLLSYSRIFGLGLTTGVIGFVINMLADIIVNTFFGGNPAGWIIAVPVLVFGHLFNIAINLLGAYVHNSRLQYIEFFGRFYEGNGRAFKPLGWNTRYTYLDN